MEQSTEKTKLRRTDVPADEEIIKLQRRVDKHIIEFERHKLGDDQRFLKYSKAHEENMEAIAALTESTQGVVDAWAVAASFQKFIKWLSGFTIVGIVVAWLAERVG